MRLVPFACAVALLVATSAAAQDPAKVASDYYKVVAENEHVRVLRVTMPPGARAAMHSHPAHVAVSLTGGTVAMAFPDGTTRNTEMKPDMVGLNPAGSHATSNPGTASEEVLVIELKGEPGTGTLPTSRPNAKMTPLLQDARVRADRVSFDPAFHEPAGSTHEFDQVVIPLAQSDTALTMNGKTRSTWTRGEAVIIGRGVPHESKVGSHPADMMIVSIK